jgi:hypothetical protein
LTSAAEVDLSKLSHISKLKIPNINDINLEDFDKYKTSLKFDNPIKVREILMQHFVEGEHDTFFEILALYMDHVGKSKISIDTKIPERTIYNFIKGQHKTSSENIFKVMKFISDQIKLFA